MPAGGGQDVPCGGASSGPVGPWAWLRIPPPSPCLGSTNGGMEAVHMATQGSETSDGHDIRQDGPGLGLGLISRAGLWMPPSRPHKLPLRNSTGPRRAAGPPGGWEGGWRGSDPALTLTLTSVYKLLTPATTAAKIRLKS
ncbi:hypothetical protein SKAU_G00281440 [Synaphobranchus kaupii]|uniref:Uncharacterized protein n=1 Tax=Synaphobranchus kaupii TaxID=118154 RepID=A0A9Q1EX48_SYNKA|nr:hypothetical protein SKAU_G00281440 [Synaphobranchus kaupii]